MDITPEQARLALDSADDAVRRLKQAIDRHSSRIVLVWGVVYLLAPLAVHFWPDWGVIPQQVLLLGAIVWSVLGARGSGSVSGSNSWRIGALWWITFAFAWAWWLILAPTLFGDMAANGDQVAKQMWAYGVSLAMFVYTIMGLWIGRLYVVVGVSLTLLTVGGLLLLNENYWLWCSVTGGGTLLATAFWLRTRGS